MRNQEHHHLRSYGEAAAANADGPFLLYHPSGGRAGESIKGEEKAACCLTTAQRVQCCDEGNLRGIYEDLDGAEG